jgi:hypothetical protein
MINSVSVAVECTALSMLTVAYTNANIVFIHIDGEMDQGYVDSLVSKFILSEDVDLIMTSGFMSEYFHDRIDDVLYDSINDDRFIMTVWSSDAFEDSVEEFLEVHGAHSNVSSGRMLILAESMQRRMELLAKVASIGLIGKSE